MKLNLLVLSFLFCSMASAQSVEFMKLCGEYSTYKDIERQAKRSGGMTAEAKKELAPLKKEFERKKKDLEKSTGEKFSEKLCKELDLL